VTKSIG